MKKRGQFYLVAVIIFVGIFIGLVTVKNSISPDNTLNKKSTVNELNIEISKLLDYLAQNNLTITNSNNVFQNFSETYTNRIRNNANVLFFYGSKTNLTVYGYSRGDDNISCNFTGSDILLTNTTQKGFVNYNTNLGTGSDFYCIVNNATESYSFYDGRNIYYLILYKNNGGDYIYSN